MITITEIANQLIEIEAKREEYKSLAENIYEFIRSDQQSLSCASSITFEYSFTLYL